MSFVEPFTYFVAEHTVLAYTIIFLGIIIEGEFILLTSGILAHLGVISIEVLLLLGILGAVSKTILGYYLGELLAKRFPESRLMKYLNHRVHHYLPRFKEQPFWSIFVSKFIYGLNNFAIVFSGYIKANFKTFFKAEFLSSLIWIPGILAIGYFASRTAFSWSRDFRKATIFIILLIAGFVIIQKIINLIIEVIEETENHDEI